VHAHKNSFFFNYGNRIHRTTEITGLRENTINLEQKKKKMETGNDIDFLLIDFN